MKIFKSADPKNNYEFLAIDSTRNLYYFIWKDSITNYIIDTLQTIPERDDLFNLDSLYFTEDADHIFEKYMAESVRIASDFNRDCLEAAVVLYEAYQAGKLEEIPAEQLLTHVSEKIRELIKTYLKSEGKDET